MRLILTLLTLFAMAPFTAVGQTGSGKPGSGAAEAALTGVPVLRPTQYFAGEWSGSVGQGGSNPAPATLKITASTDGRAMTLALNPAVSSGTVASRQTMVTLFPLTNNATVTNMLDHTSRSYDVSGLKEFWKGGSGELILTGKGRREGQDTEVRLTFRLTSTQLTWQRESRTAGSTGEYTLEEGASFMRVRPPASAGM